MVILREKKKLQCDYRLTEMNAVGKIIIVGGPDTHFRLPFAKVLADHGWDVVLASSDFESSLDASEFRVHQYHMEQHISPISDINTIKNTL